jgi:restriction system protein
MVLRDLTGKDAWLRLLSRLPWWAGVLGAILAYLALGRITLPGPAPGTDPERLLRALAGVGQWLVPAALLAAAAVAAYRRRRLVTLSKALATSPVNTTLRDLGRSDFEALVSRAFRQAGYEVGEPRTKCTGGPTEMLLTGIGQSGIVHTRYWRAWRVGAAEVRDLTAAMTAGGARRGFLVIPGEFTRDAQRMAKGKPIELIDGDSLRALLRIDTRPPAPPRTLGLLRRVRVPHIPVRYVLRLAGALIAGSAILGGFNWITNLPDKRLAPAEPSGAAAKQAQQLPPTLVELPPAAPAPAQAQAQSHPPPPGLGSFRSVQELDIAFEAFYVPPPGCGSPGSHADLVECANHRIRARQGYMAPGSSGEAQQGTPEAEEEAIIWDEEAGIDALMPPAPDPSGLDVTQQRPDAPPEPPPLPQKPKVRDPASTYAPYDREAPWVEP